MLNRATGWGATRFQRTGELRVFCSSWRNASLAVAGVMPEFEVIKDIRSLLGLGPIVPSVYALSIEHLIETFRRTIVATTAYSAHATGDVVRRQDLLVLVGDELTCDPNAELPSSGWAAPYRHQHLLHDQVAVLPATHRLAYGHSRIQTQHNVEIEPVLSRTEWSERPGVVALSPGLSSPNRTCTFQRIRLSIQALLNATATSA